ncbi:MAG: hypothetical protein ACREE4_05555 [Stellaceae bacterium]
MQQRRDRLVLTATVLEHERGDREQVRDIRNARSLPLLARMSAGGKDKSGFKSGGQEHDAEDKSEVVRVQAPAPDARRSGA